MGSKHYPAPEAPEEVAEPASTQAAHATPELRSPPGLESVRRQDTAAHAVVECKARCMRPPPGLEPSSQQYAAAHATNECSRRCIRPPPGLHLNAVDRRACVLGNERSHLLEGAIETQVDGALTHVWNEPQAITQSRSDSAVSSSSWRPLSQLFAGFDCASGTAKSCDGTVSDISPASASQPRADAEHDSSAEVHDQGQDVEWEWSAGSVKHGTGECTPCRFYWKGVCKNGLTCNFCHMPHQKTPQSRPSRSKRARVKKLVDKMEEVDIANPEEAVDALARSGASLSERMYMSRIVVSRARMLAPRAEECNAAEGRLIDVDWNASLSGLEL